MGKRILSVLLAMAMVICLIPVSMAAGGLSLEFPAQFVEIDGVKPIAITAPAGVAVACVSETPEIATVTSNGVVTGVSIGRARIKVTAGSATEYIEVPVVGRNLFTRNGIKAGDFEGGVYLGSSAPTLPVNKLWVAVRNNASFKNGVMSNAKEETPASESAEVYS